MASLKLDWCSHAAAKYAVEHWHYSKTLPMPPLVRIGVWEDSLFVGCVLFSRGASPGLGSPYGLKQSQVAELTRVAMTGHAAPMSRILSIAFQMYRERCPATRLIVSFADPSQGHHGGIYQAGNWIYAGTTKSEFQYLLRGRWVHRRQAVGKVAFGSPVDPTNWRELPKRLTPGKHRYLMPLDDEMRARILPMSKPYPKRAVSTVASAPLDQSGEGGSNPTTALSNV